MKLPCGDQCICWPICQSKQYIHCRFNCKILIEYIKKLDKAFNNADHFFEICYGVKIWETMDKVKEKIEINEES